MEYEVPKKRVKHASTYDKSGIFKEPHKRMTDLPPAATPSVTPVSV